MKRSVVFSTFALVLLLIGALMSVQVAAFAQDAATATPAPTATFVPSEEGTLTIWTDQARSPAIEAIGTAFTEQYGVPVRIQIMGFGDIRNNLVLGGPVGEGPDIIIGAHDWVGQLTSNGLLAPIELSPELLEQLDPVAIRAFTYNGQLVGLPYLTEAIGVYYNTDIIAPEDFPQTWEELTALAEQLQADGTVQRGIGIPLGSGGDPYHHYPLFTGFGGYAFGVDEQGSYNPDDVGIDNEGGIAAMQEMDRLVKAGLLNAADDYGALQSLFQSGDLAMWITGPWELNGMRENNLPFAVAPVPPMTETARPFVGSQGFMINAFSENLLLAQAFVTEFVATDEGMQLLYDAVPFIPAWNPLAETLDDEALLSFREAVANGDPMPAIPAMNSVWTAWGNAIVLVHQQQVDPAAAIEEAAEAIRAEIASSGS